MRSMLAAVAFLTAVTATFVDLPSANAQVRIYRSGWRRPYRYWRVGVGWVWVYPPPVVVAPPAPPPPPMPVMQEQQENCGQCGCCCCNNAAPAPQPSPYPEPEALPPPPMMPPAPPAPPPVTPPPPGAYDYMPPMQPRAHHEIKLGLGVSGTGFNWDAAGVKSEEGGATVHLRLRPSQHITWEFAIGGMGGKDEMGIERHDVPATVALMVFPWNWTIAPYGVAAGGANLIRQDYMGEHREDSQALAALGLGAELRLGQHFTVGFDVRHQWRWAADKNGQQSGTIDNNTGTTKTPAMSTLVPIGDETGTAYNLSATYYF
jgi:outer membrane protein with beta-barrel domain